MRRSLPFALVALCVLLVSGCEPYDRPRRPLPADLELQVLGGGRIGPEALRGRPWVLHLWVPR